MNNIICMCKVGEDGGETEVAQTSHVFLRSFPIFPQAVIKQWGREPTVSVLLLLFYTYGRN